MVSRKREGKFYFKNANLLERKREGGGEDGLPVDSAPQLATAARTGALTKWPHLVNTEPD